jgi:hypothetical protein
VTLLRYRYDLKTQLERHTQAANELAKMRDRAAERIRELYEEPALRAYQNLRRYHKRSGYRELRYWLTGKRKESDAAATPAAGKLKYRLFILLRTSGYLGVDGLAACLRYSKRQVIRALNDLEREGVIARNHVGRRTYYEVVIPDSQPYADALVYRVGIQWERLQRLRRQIESVVTPAQFTRAA